MAKLLFWLVVSAVIYLFYRGRKELEAASRERELHGTRASEQPQEVIDVEYEEVDEPI